MLHIVRHALTRSLLAVAVELFGVVVDGPDDSGGSVRHRVTLEKSSSTTKNLSNNSAMLHLISDYFFIYD